MLNGGANLQPILSLSMVRGVELSCESVPQTCVQVYLMIQSASDGNGVDFTPLPAIVTSLLAAGFISANVDYDMDCSAYFRKMEPVLYGFLPDKKSSRLLFVLLHMIHLACHCGLVSSVVRIPPFMRPRGYLLHGLPLISLHLHA